MKIPKNTLTSTKIKEKKQMKINVEQNESTFNNNTLSPMQNFPQSENMENIAENINNINNNENNVIANILDTNKIKNDINNNNNDLENNKMKNKKLSKEFSNLYNEYDRPGNFNFINISETVEPFLYQKHSNNEYSSHAFNNFKFLDIINSYKMIINIIVDDDSLKSSNNLKTIFESIIFSLIGLNEIKISNIDFLVCIFFQHFSYESSFRELFPGLNYNSSNNYKNKNNNFYCSYGNVLSQYDTPINTLLFYKESSTFVEIYKFFYCDIVSDLITLINVDPKEIGKTFLVVNWPNGKIYKISTNKYHRSRILSNIFRISNNRNMILIPDIDFTPYDNSDFFGHINKYNFNTDKIEINLFWDMICGYPIDHRFFFINMNYKLYSIFKDYYQYNKININCNPYYHDYHLSIYLRDNMKNIVIQKIQQVKIEYIDIPYNFMEFFFDYILRKGSYYANFFYLIKYFFSWRNMTCFKFMQKFFILFKLLYFIVQFFWLGLSFLISYSVFNDTFGSHGNKMDFFCSLGYAVILIILLFISLLFVKNKPKIKKNKIDRNYKRNKESLLIIGILYFVHYLYFCFFIVCAIIALIHIKQGKNYELTHSEYYVFNTDFFLVILIINILLYILPSFFRISNLCSKGFFYYLFAQLLNSTCFFHLPYIFTCITNINSKEKKKDSIYITLYVLLNGLLSVICLTFDTTRQRRMDFLAIIAIIFIILNGVKLIVVMLGVCKQNSFNKNITSGNIPQYNISNEECDDVNAYSNKNNIYINNGIKNINIKIKDNNNANNNSINNNNIILLNKNKNIKKNNKVGEDHILKKDSSTSGLFKNNKINDENEDYRYSLSQKIELKKNSIKGFGINNNDTGNDDNDINEIKRSVKFDRIFKLETEKKEPKIIKTNNTEIKSKIFFPMDSVKEKICNNIENNNNNLNYSNTKSKNYPMDNIQPFSLENQKLKQKSDLNDNKNHLYNILSESDIL